MNYVYKFNKSKEIEEKYNNLLVEFENIKLSQIGNVEVPCILFEYYLTT